MHKNPGTGGWTVDPRQAPPDVTGLLHLASLYIPGPARLLGTWALCSVEWEAQSCHLLANEKKGPATEQLAGRVPEPLLSHACLAPLRGMAGG